VLRDTLGRVIGERRVLQQDARLEPGAVLLADPREFELPSGDMAPPLTPKLKGRVAGFPGLGPPGSPAVKGL
jgi:hypothetical protein